MKKITGSPELLNILASKFAVEKSFIREAFNLTQLPELDVESKATTIREAEEEQIEVESCCNHEERAAFRKWIEFAAGDEEEILRVFERIGDCERAEPEKMLAIRAMAETLLDKK